jgi:hypothetical protein
MPTSTPPIATPARPPRLDNKRAEPAQATHSCVKAKRSLDSYGIRHEAGFAHTTEQTAKALTESSDLLRLSLRLKLKRRA